MSEAVQHTAARRGGRDGTHTTAAHENTYSRNEPRLNDEFTTMRERRVFFLFAVVEEIKSLHLAEGLAPFLPPFLPAFPD